MKRPFFLSCLLTLLLLTLYAGLALAAATPVRSLDDDDTYLEAVSPIVADPLEGFNRGMHAFNDGFLTYIARPAYTGYAWVVPSPVRKGAKNAFHNLLFPVRFVNNILQGKGKAAGVEMSRFVLNTTAGIGGIFDVAGDHKTIVPMDDEDLGQTFGVWGFGEGAYLVLPVIGPSTVRDTIGKVGDSFLDPLTYAASWEIEVGVTAARAFNNLDSTLDQYDAIKNTAVEPYTAFRDTYIQYRRAKIAK